MNDTAKVTGAGAQKVSIASEDRLGDTRMLIVEEEKKTTTTEMPTSLPDQKSSLIKQPTQTRFSSDLSLPHKLPVFGGSAATPVPHWSAGAAQTAIKAIVDKKKGNLGTGKFDVEEWEGNGCVVWVWVLGCGGVVVIVLLAMFIMLEAVLAAEDGRCMYGMAVVLKRNNTR